MMVYDLWLALMDHFEALGDTDRSNAGAAVFYLARHFQDRGMGLSAVLSATDAELLEAKGFGPKSLARFRMFVPQRYTVPRSDPWREHAEMVAGVA